MPEVGMVELGCAEVRRGIQIFRIELPLLARAGFVMTINSGIFARQ